VLGEAGAGARGRLRVTAAHYVRPLARDAHGHSQRLDPAVLATWDERLERYEHFAWGVLPEIAARLGRRGGDLEADLHHRRDDLAGLAKAGVTKLDEVQRLIAGYRVRWGDGHSGRSDGDGAAAAGRDHRDGGGGPDRSHAGHDHGPDVAPGHEPGPADAHVGNDRGPEDAHAGHDHGSRDAHAGHDHGPDGAPDHRPN
jgi:hypothetical protein